MKKKYYDIVFANASIQRFLMDVAMYFHKQENLNERDEKKVGEIINFLIEQELLPYIYIMTDGSN